MPYPTHGRGSAGNAVSRRPSTFFWEYHLEKPIYVYPMNESWAGTPLINDNSEVLGIGSLYIPDSVSPGIMSPGNMFVPINILICVIPDEKILGNSFLKKFFTLLLTVILKFILIE